MNTFLFSAPWNHCIIHVTIYNPFSFSPKPQNQPFWPHINLSRSALSSAEMDELRRGSRLTDEVAHMGIRGGNRYNRRDRETLSRSPSILMPHTETTRELCFSCLLPDLSQQPVLYLIVLSWWTDSEAWRGVRGRSSTTVSLVSSHSVMCSGALQQNHAGFTLRNPVPNHPHPSQVSSIWRKCCGLQALNITQIDLFFTGGVHMLTQDFLNRLQCLYVTLP